MKLLMKDSEAPCATYREVNSPLKKLPDELSSPPLINRIDEKEKFSSIGFALSPLECICIWLG